MQEARNSVQQHSRPQTDQPRGEVLYGSQLPGQLGPREDRGRRRSYGPTMSGPQTPEPALDRQGDCSTGSGDEGAADGIQHSHRMLSFSDALLSIIATVMILPVTHMEITPEQVLGADGSVSGGPGRPVLGSARGPWLGGTARPQPCCWPSLSLWTEAEP